MMAITRSKWFSRIVSVVLVFIVLALVGGSVSVIIELTKV